MGLGGLNSHIYDVSESYQLHHTERDMIPCSRAHQGIMDTKGIINGSLMWTWLVEPERINAVHGSIQTVRVRAWAIGGGTHFTWVPQSIDTVHNPIYERYTNDKRTKTTSYIGAICQLLRCMRLVWTTRCQSLTNLGLITLWLYERGMWSEGKCQITPQGHVALSGMLGHLNLWGFSPNIMITITNDNEPVTAIKRHMFAIVWRDSQQSRTFCRSKRLRG